MECRMKRYKKRIVSMFVLAFLLVTSVFSTSTVAYADTAQKDFLLIETSLPWESRANSKVLNEIGKTYDKITAKKAQTTDLSKYRVIIIANDQSSATYKTLKNLNSQLQTYVENGGTIVYGCCYGGFSTGSSASTILGGVKIVDGGSMQDKIVDSTSPVVTAEFSDHIALTDADLTGNGANHVYFDTNSLPAGTNIILNAGIDTQPTLIEYKMGSGTVIASGLTWEFTYDNTKYGMFSKKALDDLYLYALKLSNSSITEVPGLISSTITLDKSVYAPNDTMAITVVSEISAYRRDAKAVLKVTSTAGNPITTIKETAEKSFVAGTPVTLNESWKVGELPDNSYKISVEWFDNGTSVGKDATAFTVKKGVVEEIKPELKNKITVTPNTAKKTDTLTISDEIKNPTTNYDAKNIDVSYVITNSGNTIVWKTDKKVSELKAQKETTLTTTVPLTSFVPGEYTVTSSVAVAGKTLCKDTAKFTVIDDNVVVNTENFAGTINVTVDNTERTAEYKYTVSNKSEINAKDVKIFVKTEKASVKVDKESKKTDIQAKKDVQYTSLKDISDNSKWVPGTYKATLYLVNSKGEEVVLASTTFKIVADFYSTGYTLFSTDGKVILDGADITVKGKVYANGIFRTNGSSIKVDSVTSTKNLDLQGDTYGIVVKDKKAYASKVELPDYTEEILRLYDQTKYQHINVVTDMSKVEDEITVCNKVVSHYVPTVTLKHTLLAKGDTLSLNSQEITLGTEKNPIVFSCLNGDVTLNGTYININGIIYVPNGKVTINVNKVRLNGTIIAKEIEFHSSDAKCASLEVNK